MVRIEAEAALYFRITLSIVEAPPSARGWTWSYSSRRRQPQRSPDPSFHLRINKLAMRGVQHADDQHGGKRDKHAVDCEQIKRAGEE